MNTFLYFKKEDLDVCLNAKCNPNETCRPILNGIDYECLNLNVLATNTATTTPTITENLTQISNIMKDFNDPCSGNPCSLNEKCELSNSATGFDCLEKEYKNQYFKRKLDQIRTSEEIYNKRETLNNLEDKANYSAEISEENENLENHDFEESSVERSYEEEEGDEEEEKYEGNKLLERYSEEENTDLERYFVDNSGEMHSSLENNEKNNSLDRNSEEEYDENKIRVYQNDEG